MNNQKIQDALGELEQLKDEALAETEEKAFLEYFYLIAKLLFTAPAFKPIIVFLEKQTVAGRARYNEITTEINRLMSILFEKIRKYAKDLERGKEIVEQIRVFESTNINDVALIHQKFLYLKQIQKFLEDQGQHKIFLKEIKRIDKLLENHTEENHYLRRMENLNLYEKLRRFYRIYITYDPKEYKKIRKELADAGHITSLKSLDAQYDAFSKCIDPESIEKLSYDENFGIKSDKSAIKKICSFAKKELEKMSPKVGTRSNGDPSIRITLGDNNSLLVSVNNNKTLKIAANSNRGKLIFFFLKKKKGSGEELYKLLTGESIKGLDRQGFEFVINAIKDINKLFNRHGIVTAIHSKTIPSNHNSKTITFSRNPSYWA